MSLELELSVGGQLGLRVPAVVLVQLSLPVPLERPVLPELLPEPSDVLPPASARLLDEVLVPFEPLDDAAPEPLVSERPMPIDEHAAMHMDASPAIKGLI